MEFESIRPVLSGVAGGIIATWLTSHWSRRLPSRHNGKSRDALLRQHRPAIWTANTLFFLGLIFGIALYRVGGFDNTDWRPLGLGFGLASVLPLLAIFIVSILSGRDPRAGYVAFSFGQGMPLWATYGLLGAGSVAFVFALASLGT